ncbi:uncharacterized protein LOC121100933 isoform X3 [Ursus maritimus]|uniref:Uncharacterized protein LOC121100933 isoform X3 n=1 Tax=Ursus maritimus TaxID=29073 RepID=A0A8M1F943_URSMA|nr:uncharacterized protein LOC121100933 isoform X3 [Ursus maritimus]
MWCRPWAPRENRALGGTAVLQAHRSPHGQHWPVGGPRHEKPSPGKEPCSSRTWSSCRFPPDLEQLQRFTTGASRQAWPTLVSEFLHCPVGFWSRQHLAGQGLCEEPLAPRLTSERQRCSRVFTGWDLEQSPCSRKRRTAQDTLCRGKGSCGPKSAPPPGGPGLGLGDGSLDVSR